MSTTYHAGRVIVRGGVYPATLPGLYITTGAVAQADTIAPVLSGPVTFTNIGTSGYTASWQVAADAVGVTGYRYSINGGAWVALGNVTDVSITGRSPGTTDTFTVQARDAAGNWSSSITSTVALQSEPTPTGVGYLPSEIPAGSVLLNDNLQAGVRYYAVVEVLPSAGVLDFNDDGTFAFSNAPDGSYSFVYAVYANGTRDGSATVSLTIGSEGITEYPAPSDVRLGTRYGASGEFTGTMTGGAGVGLLVGGKIGLTLDGQLLVPIQ